MKYHEPNPVGDISYVQDVIRLNFMRYLKVCLINIDSWETKFTVQSVNCFRKLRQEHILPFI